MPLNCFVIAQLVPYDIHFWGTKQTVTAKQREDGALFGTVLKQKQSASSTNFTLFSWDNFLCSYQFIVVDKLFYPHSL